MSCCKLLTGTTLRGQRQKANHLAGENIEATYSLVSSAVELLELRQQLAAAELRQGAPLALFDALPLAEAHRCGPRREC